MNGDGSLDVILANLNGINRLYLGNNTGSFPSGANLSTDNNRSTYVNAGDVDGDGDIDLVVGNYFNQRNRVYINGGHDNNAIPIAFDQAITIQEDQMTSITLEGESADGSTCNISSSIHLNTDQSRSAPT